MGLFSGLGKLAGGLFKGVGKVVGGVAKVAAPLALNALPIGGVAGGLLKSILASKQPMGSTAHKISAGGRAPAQYLRGNQTQSFRPVPLYSTPTGYRPPPAVLRLSPVLPGGAVATPSGPVARAATPPASSYAGTGGAAPKKRRRRKATAKRRRSSSSSGRRRKSRLKFGSPAWRKKYLGHGKRKRRRAA